MDPQPEQSFGERTETLFPNGNRAVIVKIRSDTDVSDLITALGIARPRTILLLIGGADDFDQALSEQLEQLLGRGLARAAADTGALIMDGGTNAGVMAIMGKAVADRERIPPLLGVAPARKVSYPGQPPVEVDSDGALLEPNHSHFLLTDGDTWSIGSKMRCDLAAKIAAGRTVVAVLVNGGEIAKQEVLRCVRREWPIVIMEGSGRLADLIAESHKTRRPVSDPALAEIIQEGHLSIAPFDSSPAELRRLINRLSGTDLVDAWRLFAQYDLGAIAQQMWSGRILRFTLILGVLATFLTIIEQTKAMASSFPAFLPVVMRYLIIAVPIIISVLLTVSNRLKPGKKWFAFRSGAEAIKREIFLYRARVEQYQGLPGSNSPQKVLAERIAAISDSLRDPDVNTASLPPYSGPIPPPFALAEDDGFTMLSPQRYIEVRLSDQLLYFVLKAARIEYRLKATEWAIVIFGGVGTFLAALGDHLWIALTTSIVTAVTAYVNYLQLEPTLIKYNQAALSLTNLRNSWNALDPDQKERLDYGETLVMNTETVLQGELADWQKRARTIDNFSILAEKKKSS